MAQVVTRTRYPFRTAKSLSRAGGVRGRPDSSRRGAEPRPSHRLPLDVPTPGWFVPPARTMVAVLLLAAFGVGKLFSDNVRSRPGNDDAHHPEHLPGDGKGDPDGSGKPSPGNPVKGKPGTAPPFRVRVLTAGSTCLPHRGRCGGSPRPYTRTAPRRRLHHGLAVRRGRHRRHARLDLGGKLRIGEVGLVPGYAKTDPRARSTATPRTTGSRRCAGPSPTVDRVQKLDGSARDASCSAPDPAGGCRPVTLEVLSSVRGPRNTSPSARSSCRRAVG